MVICRTLLYCRHCDVQTSSHNATNGPWKKCLLWFTIPMIKFLTVTQTQDAFNTWLQRGALSANTLFYLTPKPHHPHRKQNKLIFPSFCHPSNFRFCVRCLCVFALHIYYKWDSRMPFNRFPNFVILMCFCFWMISLSTIACRSFASDVRWFLVWVLNVIWTLKLNFSVNDFLLFLFGE